MPTQVNPPAPVTRREDLVRQQLEQLPRSFAASSAVRAGISGSGDSLLVLTWSVDDLKRERAAGVRVLGRLGVTAGMRVANTLPGALATPGALLLGDVIEELGALDVPLGTIESDAAARQAWELVDRVQPEVMVLDAVTAARLFAAAPLALRSWWRGNIWLRCGTMSTPSLTVPATAGFHGWHRVWFAVPEVASFVAHSCTAERFHVDEAVGVAIIDGELVVTGHGRAQAPVRYASGVSARAATEPCACGLPGPVLDLP